MEATPGFEPGVKALQASALPLGHFAEKGPPKRSGNARPRARTYYTDSSLMFKNKKMTGIKPVIRIHGADDGVRTRDPHLGKVMLYQLSHVRMLSV